jgi:hypothetical protein
MDDDTMPAMPSDNDTEKDKDDGAAKDDTGSGDESEAM